MMMKKKKMNNGLDSVDSNFRFSFNLFVILLFSSVFQMFDENLIYFHFLLLLLGKSLSDQICN